MGNNVYDAREIMRKRLESNKAAAIEILRAVMPEGKEVYTVVILRIGGHTRLKVLAIETPGLCPTISDFSLLVARATGRSVGPDGAVDCHVQGMDPGAELILQALSNALHGRSNALHHRTL